MSRDCSGRNITFGILFTLLGVIMVNGGLIGTGILYFMGKINRS